jgi:hypothetical protein
MSLENERSTESKPMSQRQAALYTIQLAWEYYLPSHAVPSILHRCSWLNRADKLDTILTLIEQVASRDVRNPEAYVWRALQRIDPRHSSAHAAYRNRA